MIWFLLFLGFLLSLWLVGRSEWHLNRNKHNKLPSGNLTIANGEDKLFKDESGLLWELQPHIKNKFHQPDHEVAPVENPYPNINHSIPFDSKNPNLKFLSPLENGGSYEAIVQPDGAFLTEGVKQGTYNYGHPSGFLSSVKHTIFDVIPHFINSNYKSP